jgi:hypothetical protein
MAPDTFMDLIGVWLAAVLSLCVFSFLLRDNILYRLTEAIFVGGSVGIGIVLTFWNSFYPKLVVPFQKFVAKAATQPPERWVWAAYMLLSLCLGVLFLSRFSRKQAWLSRLPMAYLIGLGTGMGIPLGIQTFIFEQTKATLIPLVVFQGELVQWAQINWIATLGNTSLVVGVLCVLYYFFFSFKKTDLFSRATSRLGVAYLMLGFGASFGYTVMARISLLTGRIDFLKEDWIIGTMRYFGW